MPVERRSLRSNSKGDTSSSTNGEKTRAASSKDKAAPTTRSGANKAKSVPAKKPVTAKATSSANNHNNHTTGNDNMAADQPQRNGSDPVENGANGGGAEDVEMEEDTAGGPTPSIPTTSREHDGDQMTVVVPPAKGARLAGQEDRRDSDQDDVDMDASDEKPGQADEPVVDPRAKAVQGMSCFVLCFEFYSDAQDAMG